MLWLFRNIWNLSDLKITFASLLSRLIHSGFSFRAKQSPFAAAPSQGLYHSLYIYKGLVRALESCYDNKKSFLALCLLSRANSYKVIALVGTSFSSKPSLILASAERPCMAFVTIIMSLTRIVNKPSLWLSSLRLCAH